MVSAQSLPTIKVDGNKILTDLKISPLWLKSGQTLEIGDNIQFISVLEFNKSPIAGGGNSLIFEDVIIVTTPAVTVPVGKVWKIEHAGINENATLAGSVMTQANSCQTPTNLQITNNENATVTITWNAPANAPAYGYSISVMPSGLAPSSQDFFTVTNTTITVSTFSHNNSNINAITAGTGIDVYLISTCNVVTNEYSDPINSQGTVTCDIDNLILTDNLDGSVTANWTESVLGFTPSIGYKVAFVPQGTVPQPGDYVVESSTTRTTSRYTNNNNFILNHANVDVYVYSECNADSDSDPITATTPSTCDTPTNFQVTNNYNGTVTLNWNHPNGFTPSNNYMIAVVPQGTTPNYPGDYVAESGTSHTVNQYTNNSNPILNNDNIAVYVYSKCNTDSDSDPVTATTTSTCDLPVNLQLGTNYNGTITATWGVPVNNTPTNGYMVAVVPNGTPPQSGDYVTENTTSFSTTQYTNNTNIPNNGDVDVYVYAVCNSNSDSDPISTITTFNCDLPTNLQLTDNGNNTITATWGVPVNNTPTNGYMVAVVPNGTLPQTNDYVAESTTSFTTGVYTSNGIPFTGCGNLDVDVYVYAVCNSNSNSDLVNTTVNMVPGPPIFAFNNCTKIGATGPTGTQCDNAYSGTTLAGSVNVTGGIQEWTVPITGVYEIEVIGAKGGGAASGSYMGGTGVIIKGEVNLIQGQNLKVLVGQQGSNNINSSWGHGGGGGSFVTFSDNTPIIIAGGGGGASPSRSRAGLNATTNTCGVAGASGGSGGCSGSGGNAGYNSYNGGGGGLLTNGLNTTMGGKAFVNGGNGYDVTTYHAGGFGGGGGGTASTPDGGGGGGGGYSGGGAGSNSFSAYGGGGGGGSYIISSATNVSTSNGSYNGSNTFNGNPIINLSSYNTGHGYVNIQAVCQ